MIKGEKDIEDLDVKGMTIINLCHLFQFLASTFTCPFLLTAIDVDDKEGKSISNSFGGYIKIKSYFIYIR